MPAIVGKVKETFSEGNFLWLLTLNHLLSIEGLGKQLAQRVGGQLTEQVVADITENCSVENQSEFHSTASANAPAGDLLPPLGDRAPFSRDFYPFCEVAQGPCLEQSDMLLSFVACLQFVELMKSAGAIEPPPSLVNCAFGLLVCDQLPPGVRVNARRLALAMVQSPDRYRSRRDQQRLAKYFEAIERIHRTAECALGYNEIAEIFENIKSVADIAKARVASWVTFADSEKWLPELLLRLSVKVECCSTDILALVEMAINKEKKRRNGFVDCLIVNGDGVELSNLRYLKFFRMMRMFAGQRIICSRCCLLKPKVRNVKFYSGPCGLFLSYRQTMAGERSSTPIYWATSRSRASSTSQK